MAHPSLDLSAREATRFTRLCLDGRAQLTPGQGAGQGAGQGPGQGPGPGAGPWAGQAPWLELLSARFHAHAYERHAHDEITFGVITHGQQRFWYHRATHVAAAGELVLVNPGMVHDGTAAERSTGYRYRMAYLTPAQAERLVEQHLGQSLRLPWLARAHVSDPPLARRVVALHRRWQATPGAWPDLKSELAQLLLALASRHGEPGGTARLPAAPSVAAAAPWVARAARHLADAVREGQVLDLEDLAAALGLSPWHVQKGFRTVTGLSPRQYQLQPRIGHARDLLRRRGAGALSVAEVAAASGFADQAHLTRWFRRLCGTTPATFRAG